MRPENIRVVLNRRMKKSEISLEDAEAGIGNELYWPIPMDFGTTYEAINNGKPLLEIAPKARITKNIFGLASSLSTPKKENQVKMVPFSEITSLINFAHASGNEHLTNDEL